MTRDSAEHRFESLVRQYGALIARIVSRVARQDASAIGEEVEQKVLIGLWKQISREQTVQHPPSYIYRVAVRETVRALREEARRGESQDAGASLAQLEDAGTNPHEALVRREQAHELEGILARLSPERGQAVRAHLLGFEVREIMSMTGWNYQKARNLIARGIADVRRALLGSRVR